MTAARAAAPDFAAAFAAFAAACQAPVIAAESGARGDAEPGAEAEP